jgi:hypothetical protein
LKFSQPELRAGEDGEEGSETLLNEGESAGLLGEGFRATEDEEEPPGDTTISVKKSKGLFDRERPRIASGLEGEAGATTGAAVTIMGDDD